VGGGRERASLRCDAMGVRRSSKGGDEPSDNLSEGVKSHESAPNSFHLLLHFVPPIHQPIKNQRGVDISQLKPRRIIIYPSTALPPFPPFQLLRPIPSRKALGGRGSKSRKGGEMDRV